MKQKMKKVVAAVLAAVMVLAMSVTAFAEPTTDAVKKGDILIKSANNQKLTNRKFTPYKLFNATTNGKTGPEFKITYTPVSEKATADIITAIKGVDGIEEEKPHPTVKAEDFSTVTNWFEKADASKLQKFVRTVSLTNLEKGTEVKASDADSLVIPNLTYGYYLVKETTVSAGNDNAFSQSALVTVKDEVEGAAKPKADIDLKAEAPTVDKKVKTDGASDDAYGEKATQEIGKLVDYRVVATFPTAERAAYDTYKFEVVDTLSAGLTFKTEANEGVDAQGMTVPVIKWAKVDTPSTGKQNITELSGDIPAGITSVKESTLNVTITDLNDTEKVKIPDGANALVITYKAKVTDSATIAGEGNTNSVKINYTNNPTTSGEGETTPDVVRVYTYEANILKTDDSKEPVKLAGAKFKLCYDSEGQNPVKMAAVGAPTNLTANNAYKVSATGSSDLKLETGTDGKIKISGLKGDTTYYLVETDAPEGYNKLEGAVKVIVTDANFGEDVITASPDKTEDAPIKVVNSSGKTLPSTGGVGTTILYVVGILAMAAAVFYFVMNKKSKEAR